MSKIPVPKSRTPLSPTDSNAVGSQSRIPKLTAPAPHHMHKNGGERPRRKDSPNVVTSPSRIPVVDRRGSRENVVAATAATAGKEEVTKRTPVSTKPQRPQSIDIEDEFNHKIDRQRQQALRLEHRQESPTRKLSTGSLGQSPSRIPVATDYVAMASNDRKSGSRSSLSSSSPSRKYTPPVQSSATTTPVSSRGQSPAKSPLKGRGSQEMLKNSSNNSLNDDFESKIPLAKTRRRSSSKSPPKQSMIPTLGWSLSPERNGGAFGQPNNNSSQIMKPQDEQLLTNCDTDDVFDDDMKPKKKRFEAYVMTGDRMINLAKTPANNDFRSKYYRPQLEQIPLLNDESVSVPSSPNSDDQKPPSEVQMRAQPVARRSMVRTSKSEDQLMLLEQSSPDVDDVSGSVHTLLDTSGPHLPPPPPPAKYHYSNSSSSVTSSSTPTSSSSSSSRAQNPVSSATNTPKRSSSEAMSSDAKKPLLQPVVSPDISTSSLISASEHYNGESLLDNISPQTSSSPDTPEWSLMDSYHKKNGETTANGSTKLNNSSDLCVFPEKEKNNRTVISIGGQLHPEKEAQFKVLTSPTKSERAASFVTASPTTASPAFSTPTSTKPEPFSPAFHEPKAASATAAAGSPTHGFSSISSSEEESDMESLHSYHPPAKIIDIPSAIRLAKRLFYLDGFKKTDVSRHLSRNNDFNQVVAEEYLKFFEFTDCTLDMALRMFLGQFCLTGETQERERVLIHFSKRYLECNPAVAQGTDAWFKSQDSVHTLTCAIMLLNTDMHGDNHLQRKMTCSEFIENLSELNDGSDFPRELLKNIYYAIKHESIPWSNDADLLLLPADATTVPNVAAPSSGSPTQSQPPQPHFRRETEAQTSVQAQNVAIGKTGGGINPFLALPDPDGAVDYKKGYVMRKCCYDPHGKKTKLGKRSWRMFFLSLRDMILYCFKEDKSSRLPGAYEDLNCAIRVHHGLAERAADYTKKEFVFRLYTSDQAQYLFETSDEKELITWIDAINYVVAAYSAPQLPAPCSSDIGRFQRPLMPSAKTTLSFNDQLRRHEQQLMQLRCDIEDHLQNPPPKSAKSHAVQAYRDKQEFLKYEIMRYETYILTLRTRSALDQQNSPGQPAPGGDAGGVYDKRGIQDRYNSAR